MEVTAVLGSHHALSRPGRDQQQQRLANRLVVGDRVDPPGGVDHEADRRVRRRVVGRDPETPASRARAHAAPATNCWPGSTTLYFTIPGGVPSVKPQRLSRHTAWPSMRMKAEYPCRTFSVLPHRLMPWGPRFGQRSMSRPSGSLSTSTGCFATVTHSWLFLFRTTPLCRHLRFDVSIRNFMSPARSRPTWPARGRSSRGPRW